jgi:RNA recognition motif-containing protein
VSCIDCPWYDKLMTTRLHVGNLTAETTESEIGVAFRQEGREVTRVDIVTSRDPGRSRGCAFVEMATADHARAAIAALDGQMMNGRALRVRAAHTPKSRFGGFRGFTRSAGDDQQREAP